MMNYPRMGDWDMQYWMVVTAEEILTNEWKDGGAGPMSLDGCWWNEGGGNGGYPWSRRWTR